MPSAVAIYQSNLDQVSEALWRGDVPGILHHIALPNSMLTEDASFIINSSDEMVIVANDFRDHMISVGADGYRRTCISARYVSLRKDLIVGMHETRLRAGDRPFGQPFLNRMTLLHRQGRWQAVLLETSIKNTDLTILSPDLVECQKQALAKLGVSLTRP
ncbi:hypothetical protein [Pseudotabrizicola sp. L79]|uniref:hypothetical protein n=1 Tax=Pseudotabrizicola sp. L79 TaxID=3118402 RepID=UPI002F94A364